MKFYILISLAVLAGCDKLTEDLKLRQAHNIYSVGSYSFLASCPKGTCATFDVNPETVKIEHTLCDIKSLDVSSEPIGPKIYLHNCRADGQKHDSVAIVIETKDGGNQYLHGWHDQPQRIYPCNQDK